MRHTDYSLGFTCLVQYSVTMELLLSQHWRLPTAVVIPMLQNRLEICFHKEISLAIEIRSVDWAMVFGQAVPSKVIDSVRAMESVEGSIPIGQIRVGSKVLLEALQQQWYVQKNRLFISEEISPEDLELALQSWLHEIALQRSVHILS